MSDDARASRVLKGKELARELRKQAYRREKERRATDPRHLAMKEAARAQRRALYQRVKEQRKGAASEAKAREKQELKARKAEERAAADRVLLEAVGLATGGRPRIALREPAHPAASDPEELPHFHIPDCTARGSTALN